MKSSKHSPLFLAKQKLSKNQFFLQGDASILVIILIVAAVFFTGIFSQFYNDVPLPNHPTPTPQITLTIPDALKHLKGVPGTGAHKTGAIPSKKIIPPSIYLQKHHYTSQSSDKPQNIFSKLFHTAHAQSTGALPVSDFQLVNYLPPVEQQQNGSCTSWASGYYLRGWYAIHDGYCPTGGSDNFGGFAPMYLYSQLSPNDTGASFPDNLDMLVNQGVDTRADYSQGDSSLSPPTLQEIDNARYYKIAQYEALFSGGPFPTDPNVQKSIETSITTGNPIAIALKITGSWVNTNATFPLITDVGDYGGWFLALMIDTLFLPLRMINTGCGLKISGEQRGG